jgi:hypothetical protein
MLGQVNPGLVQGRVYRKTMVNCSTVMNMIKTVVNCSSVMNLKKSSKKLEKNFSVGEETLKKYL